jgi:hypothetical protein
MPAGSPGHATSPEQKKGCVAEKPLTPEERLRAQTGLTREHRLLRARRAAFAMHAKHDPHETTRAARSAFMARFERESDPDAARRAYFTRLSNLARRRGGAE